MSVIDPESPEWLTTMSASKVAAVVGLSPWESRFSLWHLMSGRTEREPQTATHRRGHYLEPAIAAWWSDQHPDLSMGPSLTFTHPDHEWATATPDAVIWDGALDVPQPEAPVAVLECKSAADDAEWGAPGTDEIPAGYACQVQWQLACSGAPLAYVAVLTSRLEFREYVVKANAEDQAWLLAQAEEFMASLPGGASPKRPDLDDHKATYVAVRALSPGVTGETVEIDPATAVDYIDACAAEREADKAKRAATTRIADLMGDAKYAALAGQRIARRQVKGGATPHVVSIPQKES